MGIRKINESTLTAIADAIRSKTGGSALINPEDMASEIESISTGGEWTTDGIADGSEPSGNLEIGSTTLVQAAFKLRKNIHNITLTNYVGNGSISEVFRESSVVAFVAKKLVATGQYWFYNCQNLLSAIIPNCTYLEYCTFQNCSALEVVDCNGSSGITRGLVFNGCKSLQTLILRSQTLSSLGNVGNFANTPFDGYGGKTGTLYVPQALISSYQSAANWSTLYSNGTMQILKIEGSQYETHYADGTEITA